MHRNIVYADDHFYYFDSDGVIFDFDLSSHTVTYQLCDEHMFPNIHNREWCLQPKRNYLMKQKGKLFFMYTPLVYKIVSSIWEEMTGITIDGLAIFSSVCSLETRVDVLGMTGTMCNSS